MAGQRGGSGHLLQARRVVGHTDDGLGDQLRGQVGIVDEQPTAGLFPGGALNRCSPLPIGNGTYFWEQPTALTSATVIAPDRQIARSAAA